MTIEELQEANGPACTEEAWTDTRNPDPERLIGPCGALVCMDKKDKVVQFAHRTVLQLCLSEMVRKSQGLDPFHLRLAEANCRIGDLCVAHLSFSDFETAVTGR